MRIAGEGPERANLELLAHSLHAEVHFLGGCTQEQVRDAYRTAGLFVHTSETGSLDKVVLEAIACGLPVITTDPSLRALPVTVKSATPESVAEAIRAPHQASSTSLATYVQEHHSLPTLITRISRLLQ